jgi:hypothetical protein
MRPFARAAQRLFPWLLKKPAKRMFRWVFRIERFAARRGTSTLGPAPASHYYQSDAREISGT